MSLAGATLPIEDDAFVIPQWWHHIRQSDQWQAGVFYGLAAAYAVLAAFAGTQLVRIVRRCHQFGWTTQKAFHLLNLIVCAMRALVMLSHSQLDGLNNVVLKLLLSDFPGLLFFTTYTLLVLFWAEIYHQARSQPTTTLRPVFIGCNAAVYAIQLALLLLCGVKRAHAFAAVVSSVFLLLVSIAAAAGFLSYGGRLFLMLHRFPIESPGRQKKLREVGAVATVCFTSFALRAAFVAASIADAPNFRIDVTGHPLLNALYYTLVEILPSGAVLWLLRKLPPRRPAVPLYAPVPEAPGSYESGEGVGRGGAGYSALSGSAAAAAQHDGGRGQYDAGSSAPAAQAAHDAAMEEGGRERPPQGAYP